MTNSLIDHDALGVSSISVKEQQNSEAVVQEESVLQMISEELETNISGTVVLVTITHDIPNLYLINTYNIY